MNMSNREALVIKHSLRNMLEGDYLNICTIDKCLKILNLKPDKKIYDTLHALHCVHYDEMSTELLKEVHLMLRELFNPDRVLSIELLNDDTVMSENFKSLIKI